MNIEESIKILNKFNKIKINSYAMQFVNISYPDLQEAIETLLTAYEKEKEKNKNKDKILRNIRDEFLKYNWKDANPIQTYNQVKSLYESIYCKPYED